MPADLTTLKARLAEAEAVEHDWSIGKKSRRINVDGHEIEYSEAGLKRLSSYISKLQADIARAGGSAADGGRRRRAMAVRF